MRKVSVFSGLLTLCVHFLLWGICLGHGDTETTPSMRYDPLTVRQRILERQARNPKNVSPITDRHLSEYEACADLFHRVVPESRKSPRENPDAYREKLPLFDEMVSKMSIDNPYQIPTLSLKLETCRAIGDEKSAKAAAFAMIERLGMIAKSYDGDARVVREFVPRTLRAAAQAEDLSAEERQIVEGLFETWSHCDDTTVKVNLALNKGRYYMSAQQQDLDKAAENYDVYFSLLPQLYGDNYKRMAVAQRIRFAHGRLLAAGRQDLARKFVEGMNADDVSVREKGMLDEIRSEREEPK